MDITNLKTCELITKRKTPDTEESHYLDYFHSAISVSPNYEWIVDNGWVWHPRGVLTTWNLKSWLENVWETENGDSKFEITSAAYFWDRPLCWIDNNTIAYWGIGDDDEEMEDAVVVFDLLKRDKIKTIKNVPNGELLFSDYLFCSSAKKGLSIWDIETTKLIYSNESVKTKIFTKFKGGFITNVSKNKIELLTLCI